ncbi:MAG: hypothetical protein NHG36_02560 [Chromatiaceae bacterium]|nr:hypothetical protein [Candidatus Thioaporhodococcus sediminis]
MDIAAAATAINGTGQPEMRELRLVQPHELGRYWELIKPGLVSVHEKASDGWLIEDVYMALKQGVSVLYIGFVSQYYVGFVVATPAIGWTGPQLHLWALYNRGERDLLETFLPDLLEIARARGAVRITMQSPRRGWERRGAALGMHYINSQFAMEV